MAKVYLLFGGNLENPTETIEKAKHILEKIIGNINKSSSYFESEPWGFDHNNSFINQVVIFNTHMLPLRILENILKTEILLGRKRKKEHYAARTIDIDILFYDSEIIQLKNLIIPHPRIHKRRFALEPLFEIEADFIHPVLKKTIQELLQNCEDKLWVKKIE